MRCGSCAFVLVSFVLVLGSLALAFWKTKFVVCVGLGFCFPFGVPFSVWHSPLAMASWSIGQLSSCSIGQLASCSAGWLANWPVGQLASWSVGQLVNWPVGQLVNWPVGQLVNWPVAQLSSWPVGQLASWPVAKLASWSIGQLSFSKCSSALAHFHLCAPLNDERKVCPHLHL